MWFILMRKKSVETEWTQMLYLAHKTSKKLWEYILKIK